MPIQSNYLLIASMDVEPDKEALFNEVYDQEHVPAIKGVPGVLSVARFQRQDLTLVIGGERRTIRLEEEPRNMAVYELDNADVLTTDAWAEAVDSGRWPEQVRPYTSNRKHFLLKRL